MKRFVTIHPQQRNAFYIANEYDVAGPSFNLNLYKVTQAAFKEEKHGISVIQSFVFAECICNKTQGGESSRKKIFHLLLSLPVWICPPFCRLLLPAICSRDFLEPWRYRLYQTQNIFHSSVANTNHGCHIPPNLWLTCLITFPHFQSENLAENLSSSKSERILVQ